MPSKHDHIGEVIRARREQLGLSQRELCARLGWGPERKGDISAIESGKVINLTLDRLSLFAAALDCHPGDLVFMLNPKRPA